MEQDENISLKNCYNEFTGDDNAVAQFIDDISKGNIQMEIHTKSLPKTPVKLTKKNLTKYLQ